MKNKIPFALLFAAVFIIGSLILFNSSPTSHDRSSQISTNQPAESNFKNLVRASRQEMLNETKSKQSSESQECSNYQNALLTLNFNDFQFPPKLTTVPEIPKQCLTDENAKLVDQALKKCAPFMNAKNPVKATSQEQWEKDFGDCKVSLIFLRGRIVAQEYENEKIEDIKDVKVLSDLLLAAFSQTDESGDAFSEIGKIAERMLELDPSLYFAAKVGVMAKIMDVIPLLGKSTDVDWSKVDAAIERALSYHQNDQELAELMLFAKSQGFQKPDFAQGDLGAIEKQFPGTGITHYYRAYFSWKSGNRNDTISHLNDALRESPNDSRFKSTLEKVRDPNLKAGEGAPFIITLKLGLDMGDV